MRSRYVIAAVSMLLLGIMCNSQGTGTAQIGATVENIRFEKGTRVAFVRVANTSSKDINGFNLSINVTYHNGQKYHYERLVDFLPKMISRQNQSRAEDGALRAGDRYEERLDLPLRGGVNNIAVAVSANVDVAAYSDSTADVENDEALSRLASLRHNSALADRKAAEIINAALADTITPDPRGVAIAQLRSALERSKRTNGERELEVELIVILSDLETMRGSRASNSDLRQYAAKKYGDSEELSAHVLLRRSR